MSQFMIFLILRKIGIFFVNNFELGVQKSPLFYGSVSSTLGISWRANLRMYMLASVCRPQRAEVRVGGAELPHPATSVTSYTEVILVGSTLDTGIREREIMMENQE